MGAGKGSAVVGSFACIGVEVGKGLMLGPAQDGPGQCRYGSCSPEDSIKMLIVKRGGGPSR